MAFMTQKNWTNTSYTAATWTALVSEASVVSTLIITNPSASPVTVSLRLSLSSAIILPEVQVAAGASVVLEARSLSIPAGDGIECWGAETGAHFIASGATE